MWITKIFILKLEIWTRCKRNGRWWWMLTMDLGLRSFTKHWRNMGSFACMKVTTGVCFATIPHQLWKNDNQGVSINLKYWVVPRISLYFFYRELAPNDGWWLKPLPLIGDIGIHCCCNVLTEFLWIPGSVWWHITKSQRMTSIMPLHASRWISITLGLSIVQHSPHWRQVHNHKAMQVKFHKLVQFFWSCWS